MAEGARLESVYTFARIEGSNPSLTAIILKGLSLFDSNLFLLPDLEKKQLSCQTIIQLIHTS